MWRLRPLECFSREMSLKEYEIMKQRSVDIFVVIAISIIAGVLVFVLPPDNVPGRILTLPLVFLLPGYALTAAFPGREALDIPKRLVFILGISLVVVVIGGLILNFTSFGLNAGSWAVYLSSITIAASIVALIRRQRGSVAASGALRAGAIGFTFRQGLLLGLAALIVCAAFALSIIGAERQPTQGFTQLWLIPAAANANKAISLGVSNMEGTTMEYRLALSINGKVVQTWPSIDLNPNQNWTTTLVIPPSTVSSSKVEAVLYRADAPTKIYRYVILWLGS